MEFTDWHGKMHRLPKGEKVLWRPSGYAVVIRRKKVLLHHSKVIDRWALPGGGIELEETLEQGVRREVLEETGYAVRITSVRPFFLDDGFFYALDTGQFFHTVLFGVVASVEDKPKRKPSDMGESDGCEWFSFEEVEKLDLSPFTRRMLDAFFSSQMVGSR